MTPQRVTAIAPPGTVVFIVGMRINQLWAIHKWLPVSFAMPRMLREQMMQPELGVLGKPRSFVSGRVVMVVQYWRSYEHLDAYAKSPASSHLAQWRAFNRRARNNSAVGVFHETYALGATGAESIYVNIPEELLLGAAVGVVPVGAKTETSRERIAGAPEPS